MTLQTSSPELTGDLDLGRAEVQKRPSEDGNIVVYMPPNSMQEELQKFALGFNPYQVAREDVPPVHTFAMKGVPAAGLGMNLSKAAYHDGHPWPEGAEQGVDIGVDSVTGLLFTLNEKMDTWRDIPGSFFDRFTESAMIAVRNRDDFATHFDGENLLVVAITKSGEDALAPFFEDETIMTARAVRTADGTGLAMLADAGAPIQAPSQY